MVGRYLCAGRDGLLGGRSTLCEAVLNKGMCGAVIEQKIVAGQQGSAPRIRGVVAGCLHVNNGVGVRPTHTRSGHQIPPGTTVQADSLHAHAQRSSH